MKSRIAEKKSDQLKQLFAKNPDSLLFSRVADLYRKEGDIKQAIGLCQNGLEVHPEYITGRIILGRCYIEIENYDSAIEEFTTICKMDRKNHVAIKMLADIFVKRGETQKAGDLYRILKHLDPFDASFKILASRFDTTGKNDLLDILGVQTPADTGMPEYYSSPDSDGTSDDYSQNAGISGDISGNESGYGDSSIEQMLSSFTEESPAPSPNDIGVTGADIDNRMDSLFGEDKQVSSNLIQTDSGLGNGISDEADPILEDSESMQPVSGKDISSRIDELFDMPEIDAVNMPDIRKDGITEKIFLDNHLPSDTSQIESEELQVDDPGVSGVNVSEHTVSEDISETIASSEDDNESVSDNIIPFTASHAENDPVNDEFEETLQFDRSMFSRLNDEPDYETLTSSSPFMATGKTEEIYQEPNDGAEGELIGEDINNVSHSDDACVQYELQSLNYEADDEESEENTDRNVVDNVHINSPLSTVTEDTVFHGNDHFGDPDNNDITMAGSDDEVAGFFNADNFVDTIEDIFGENKNQDSIPSEIHTSTDGINDLPEIDIGSSVNNIGDIQSTDDFRENPNLEIPDFDVPELSDVADKMTDVNVVEDSAEKNDIISDIENAICEENIGDPDLNSENIKPEDDLLAFQSKMDSENSADTELPGSDLFVKTLDELNLNEDSLETDGSDSEHISSVESLILLQNEDENEHPVDSNVLTDGVNNGELAEKKEMNFFKNDISDDSKDSGFDLKTSDLELLQESLQPIISDGFDAQDTQSGIVEDIPDDLDIFDNISEAPEVSKNSDGDLSTNTISDATTEEEENARNEEFSDNDQYLDSIRTDENSAFVQKNDLDGISITDTGISVSESGNDLKIMEDAIHEDDPVLLIDNESDNIVVESDESVVSDMDVLIVSPEDEQMTGDDVAEKIQDIFELAESEEKRQFFVKEEDTFKLVEDDQEYTLDNISGTNNPAMVDLSDETFVEKKGDYINDVRVDGEIDRELPVQTNTGDLILGGEPEETLFVTNQGNRSSLNDEKNSATEQEELSFDVSASESQYDQPDVVQDRSTGTDELIIEASDNSQVISGADVEDRLNEFFGKDILDDSSVNNLIPDDEEIEETIIQDFYTLSGENTATAGECEIMDGVDKVELDQPVDFIDDQANPEMSENETIVNLIEDDESSESLDNELDQPVGNIDDPANSEMSENEMIVNSIEDDELSEPLDNELDQPAGIIDAPANSEMSENETIVNSIEDDELSESLDNELDQSVGNIDAPANSEMFENEMIVNSIEDDESSESLDNELDQPVGNIDASANSEMSENEMIVSSIEENESSELSNGDVQMSFDRSSDDHLNMGEMSEAFDTVESEILPEMVDEENEPDISGEMQTAKESIDGDERLDADESQQEDIGRFSAADLFDDENAVPIEEPTMVQSFGKENQPVQEIDERDAPYTIPDHVLTPTLADIYFQQGQLQLALQIYTRLYEQDPDNDRIQSRIIEIKTCIEKNQNENDENQGNHACSKNDKKSHTRASMKENPLKNDTRPLAGVRIPKKKKIKREQRKKT